MPYHHTGSGKLLGRKYEFAALANLAPLAVSGDAGSVILSGRRGTGKTALLRHVYSSLFHKQKEVIPFFYRVRESYPSVDSFAEDYTLSFAVQGLAFAEGDQAEVYDPLLSLDDLSGSANSPEVSWIKEIITGFRAAREKGDAGKLLAYSLSIPLQIHRRAGVPVIVLVDDVHRLRNLSSNAWDDAMRADLWTCLEKALQYHSAPHVLAGVQSRVHQMFFEESSLGEDLELFMLSGLSAENTFALFSDLCRSYNIQFQGNVKQYMGLFNGNPLYVKSFIQSARQKTDSISDKNFWDIYLHEITSGKMNTYWMSILSRNVLAQTMRKNALSSLYELGKGFDGDSIELLADKLSLSGESMDAMISSLKASGALDVGFTSVHLSDDRVLADVVKGIYHREVLRESADQMRDAIAGGKKAISVPGALPQFMMTIPSDQKAEKVAVETIEQIGRYFSVTPEDTAQLQIALVELFSGVLNPEGISAETYTMTVLLKDGTLLLEVITMESGITPDAGNIDRIRAYLSDVKVDESGDSMKITLIKEIRGRTGSA